MSEDKTTLNVYCTHCKLMVMTINSDIKFNDGGCLGLSISCGKCNREVILVKPKRTTIHIEGDVIPLKNWARNRKPEEMKL